MYLCVTKQTNKNMKKVLLFSAVAMATLIGCKKEVDNSICPTYIKNIKVNVISPKETGYTLIMNGSRIKTNHTNNLNNVDTFNAVTINQCESFFNIQLIPDNDLLNGFTFNSSPISRYFPDSEGTIKLTLHCYNK